MTERRLYESGVGRTVGAQTITLCALMLPADCFAIIEMKLGGLAQSGLAGGAVRTTAIKKVGGILTNLGDFSAQNLKGDAGLAGVVVAPGFNNGAIELQVTGVAGQVIDWTGVLMGVLHLTNAA